MDTAEKDGLENMLYWGYFYSDPLPPRAVIKLVQVDNGEVVLDLRPDGKIRSFPAPPIREPGLPPTRPRPASVA